MISVRYLCNWIKEAGRGHVTAFLSWGGFFVYTALAVFGIRSDPVSSFFGIGSRSLLNLCMGLGIFTAGTGFWYLEQPVKLDFYYSLPVKRGTIFWSRYVHGLFQVTVPLFISMTACGIYECGVNQGFIEYAGSYVIRSAVVFLAVFLIFYHVGIVCFLAGGRIITVLLLFGAFFCAGQVIFQGIGRAYAKYFFQAYYRIPVLETFKEMLTPGLLSLKLTGASLYDKREVLEYVPEKGTVFSAVSWILLFAVLMVYMEKKRKVENVGKVFAFPAGERAAVFFISVVPALLFGNIFMGSGIVLVFLFHIVAEFLIQGQGRKAFKRKRQMLAEGAFVLLVTAGFAAGAKAFDGFLPERDELSALGICVNGIDMPQTEYMKNSFGEESYETERKLEQYTFKEDGLTEGLSWIGSLNRKMETEGGGDKAYTFATVCYQMRDGKKRYRVYPADEEDIKAFAVVFETEEYKEKAYPALLWENVGDNRFSFKDGVRNNQVLKLTKEEKETFLKLYKKEVMEFRMEELREAAPAGIVEMRSEKWGETEELLIYPFFKETYAFLQEHGEIKRDLFDYPVRSLKVMESYAYKKGEEQVTDGYVTGSMRVEHYETEEELRKWRGRLIWAELDVQPLLYPLNYRGGIEAEAEEPESGAMVKVECCEKNKE